MSNPILETIASRRSHRAYENTPVTDEQLQVLIDACLQSPSAVNRQPWHLTAVRNQALLEELNAECIAQMMKKPPEQRSPRLADPNYNVFYRAPMVLFLSADPAWRYSGFDCGVAAENINLAAESIGLGCVILGMPRAAFEGERKAEFEQKLGFLPGEEYVMAISVGVPADTKGPHTIREGHITIVD